MWSMCFVKKLDKETWLCRTHLDAFLVDFGQIWIYLDSSIWTHLGEPVYLDRSDQTRLFGPVYLDLSIWTRQFGPIYLDYSV